MNNQIEEISKNAIDCGKKLNSEIDELSEGEFVSNNKKKSKKKILGRYNKIGYDEK